MKCRRLGSVSLESETVPLGGRRPPQRQGGSSQRLSPHSPGVTCCATEQCYSSMVVLEEASDVGSRGQRAPSGSENMLGGLVMMPEVLKSRELE